MVALLSLSFWNSHLENLKHQYHNTRNRYRRGRVHIDVYKKARNAFTHAIRKARQQKWIEFLEECDSSNAYGNTYKVLKSKVKAGPKELPILDVLDSSLLQPKMANLLDSLFPNADPADLIPPPLPFS